MLYAAATASRLGLQAAIYTAARAPLALPVDCLLAVQPSPVTTTFANCYHQGRRSQWLHAHAAAITPAGLPANWRAAPIVHLGPVARECDIALLDQFPRALVGVTAQGWLRRWCLPLPAPVEPARWHPASARLAQIDLLVLSLEDIQGDEQVAAAYARHCRLVVLTRGAAGATLFSGGVARQIAAFPAREVDPTGAGDVFAAAMLVRLAEGAAPVAAAEFAAAAAAAAVEGRGIRAIPTRNAVLALMAGTRAPLRSAAAAAPEAEL